MAIRVKLRKIHPMPEVAIRINFDIKQIGGDNGKLHIAGDEDGRELSGKLEKDNIDMVPKT